MHGRRGTWYHAEQSGEGTISYSTLALPPVPVFHYPFWVGGLVWVALPSPRYWLTLNSLCSKPTQTSLHATALTPSMQTKNSNQHQHYLHLPRFPKSPWVVGSMGGWLHSDLYAIPLPGRSTSLRTVPTYELTLSPTSNQRAFLGLARRRSSGWWWFCLRDIAV